MTKPSPTRSSAGFPAGCRAGVLARASRPENRISIPPSEQGYILLFAIFLTALLVIALAIAAPQVAKSIQRDKEQEAFNRGMQYRRAIQLYYRKFNAYPPNIDALVQTNNIRFLRKKYLDPMTGKDDWKPILFGQNKAPTAMGFFGQPLAGTTIAGTGPGGGNVPGSTGGVAMPPGIFGVDTSGGPSTPNSTDSSGTGTSGGPDSSGGASGSGTPGTGTTGGPGSPTGTGQTGMSGQTFGGAGIIGVKLPLEKKSILVYKKKDHYNEWEFTYDPISDRQMMPGAGGANPANPMGNGTNSQNPTNSPSGAPPGTTPNTQPSPTPQY